MKQSVLSNLGAFHIVMTEGAGDVAAAAVAMTLVDYTYLTNWIGGGYTSSTRLFSRKGSAVNPMKYPECPAYRI